ncbi:unnamed protein product [Trichogramma brassicae]|uniref:Uncharacterized protein n=1 Tax=Trichogramma brassicae TaxID=86971 RepID=A0A6H5I537_9HYME|nr:unnamed protein product [Trichogramma brassicae]
MSSTKTERERERKKKQEKNCAPSRFSSSLRVYKAKQSKMRLSRDRCCCCCCCCCCALVIT